jgi:hypothetical protein
MPDDLRGALEAALLTLEDERLVPAARQRLQARESALLKVHERAWLGDKPGVQTDPQLATAEG